MSGVSSKPADCSAAGSPTLQPTDYIQVSTTFSAISQLFPGITVAGTFTNSDHQNRPDAFGMKSRSSSWRRNGETNCGATAIEFALIAPASRDGRNRHLLFVHGSLSGRQYALRRGRWRALRVGQFNDMRQRKRHRDIHAGPPLPGRTPHLQGLCGRGLRQLRERLDNLRRQGRLHRSASLLKTIGLLSPGTDAGYLDEHRNLLPLQVNAPNPGPPRPEPFRRKCNRPKR